MEINMRSPERIGILVVFMLLAGCGGGPTQQPDKIPSLTLAADLVGVSVGETVDVEIYVADVEDLYGVALDIVYPPEVFNFTSCVEGAFFGQDGLETNEAYALESGEEGRLVVGLSRVGDVGGVEGSGSLATCKFKILTTIHPTSFELEKATLLDSELVAVSISSGSTP